MRLPTSLDVTVNLYRNRFPDRVGFGVAMLLTTQSIAEKLDANNLTRTYASMAEVKADFAVTDAFYIAANSAFSQRPSPKQVVAGYVAKDAADPTIAEVTEALDAIENVDGSFYWIDVEAAMRDKPCLDAIVTWVNARRKQAIITSNDVLMEDKTNNTNFAARHKGETERVSVFYSTNAAEYPGFAFAAKLGTFDFDQAGAAYTGKYKSLIGIETFNKGLNAVQAITGNVAGLGSSTATGHCANVYTDTGGLRFVREGMTLTPALFIDDVHFGDWLVANIEQDEAALLANAKRVPFDGRGMTAIAQAAEVVMGRAFSAGAVANDVDENGDFAPAFTVNAPDALSVSEAQRANRIAPPVEVDYRYAGAVHHINVNVNQSY